MPDLPTLSNPEQEALARKLAGEAMCDIRSARTYVSMGGEILRPLTRTRLDLARQRLVAQGGEPAELVHRVEREQGSASEEAPPLAAAGS